MLKSSTLIWLGKHRLVTRSIACRLFCVGVSLFAVSRECSALEPNVVRAGNSFVLEFPNLREDRRGNVAKMQVRIPESYSPTGLYPVFVWLGGGAGSGSYGPAVRIADPANAILVGLPYPKGANDSQQATMVGDFRRIWGFHKTMLNTLATHVPNMHPRRVVIAGFSNGAHCIDGYLKMDEPAASFSAFLIVEGGGYRGRSYSKAAKGKPVLVMWGDRSPHRRVGPRLARELRRAQMNVTSATMRGVEHKFPTEFQNQAHAWLRDL